MWGVTVSPVSSPKCSKIQNSYSHIEKVKMDHNCSFPHLYQIITHKHAVIQLHSLVRVIIMNQIEYINVSINKLHSNGYCKTYLHNALSTHYGLYELTQH